MPAVTAVAAGEGAGGHKRAEGGPPLTEHALQPDKAADETVEVNVHVFVGVSHGDDVIELAVEVEACGASVRGRWGGVPWACVLSSRRSLGHSVAWGRRTRTFLLLFSIRAQQLGPPLPFLLLLSPHPGHPLRAPCPGTCIVDCISHLIAVDGAGLVGVIVFENFLAIEKLRSEVTH